jgi:hypothetical protein
MRVAGSREVTRSKLCSTYAVPRHNPMEIPSVFPVQQHLESERENKDIAAVTRLDLP